MAFLVMFIFSFILIKQPALADTVYTFQGTLKNSNGQVLPAFNIHLENTDASFAANLTTDENGVFNGEVFADTYAVTLCGGDNTSATMPDYIEFKQTGIVIAGNTTLDLTIPVRNLSLTVNRADGQPLSNATVSTGTDSEHATPFTLYPGGSNFAWLSSRTNRYTDANGQVVLPVIPATGVTVTISPYTTSGLPTHTFTVDTQNDTVMTVNLPTTYQLSGTLKSDGGQTLPGFNVHLANSTGTSSVDFATDENGVFSARLVPDTYTINLTGGEQYTGTTPVFSWYTQTGLVIANDTTLNLVVPIRYLTLTVNDSNHQPVPNATVSVEINDQNGQLFSLYAGGNNFYQFSTTTVRYTDANGQVVLPVLPAVAATINVFPDQASGLPKIGVTENTTSNATATITLPATYIFSGTLKSDNGQALAGFDIHLVNAALTSSADFVTDQSGAFSARVTPDTYSMEINGGDHTSGITPHISSLIAKGLVINQDTNLALTIPINFITITVNDYSGSPLANSTIQLLSTGADVLAFPLYSNGSDVTDQLAWHSLIVTDANGQAVVPFIPTRKATILVYPDPLTGLNVKTVTANLPKRDTTKTITFRRNRKN